LRYAKVISCLFILPGEDWLLEAAEETPEIDIEEHRRMAYLSCLTKFKEVVLQELVALHKSHHISTTLEAFLVDLIPDDN
jgi:hypothetical protein